MALGMAKDSMVDLQSLAQEKNDARDDEDGAADTVSLLTTGQSRGAIEEYKKLYATPVNDPANEEEEDIDHRQLSPAASEEIQPSLPGATGDSSSTTPPRLSARLDTSSGDDDVEEEKKQDPMVVPGQYEGFKSDYEAYNYDSSLLLYHQSQQTILGGPKASSGGLLCCLFPWFQKASNDPNKRITEHDEDEEKKLEPQQGLQQGQEEQEPVTDESKTSNGAIRKTTSAGEDDDISTVSHSSDRLGEKLSDKDRQAVLARLRLAQPDGGLNSPSRSSAGASDSAGGSPGSSDKENKSKKGLLNDIPNLPLNGEDNGGKDGGIKGILKRQSTTVKTPESKAGTDRRRSLFPTYETTKPKKNTNHISFAPMARVVTVKSQKDMTAEEKSSIWWQRWDYEDFRKTGRIITRAMLEGGSEIWLASNQSWQHMGASKSATLKNAMSLSDTNRSTKNGTNEQSNETADLIESTGDKWWHKFGHSRRGLEHIASIKEGSERQANVRYAIRTVLDEQRRQKTFLREDPEKLRMISLHNTSWARDLAVAAGHSDADAVKSDFDEERKSREFYLLKMARQNSISSQGKHVPAFMQPAINSITSKLDANTSAQIMYRRKQSQQRIQLQQKEISSEPPSASAAKKDKPPTKVTRTMEPIHDHEPEDEGHTNDLAKRAAGFSHDGAEQVNMAAVLSGMGAVAKIAQPV